MSAPIPNTSSAEPTFGEWVRTSRPTTRTASDATGGPIIQIMKSWLKRMSATGSTTKRMAEADTFVYFAKPSYARGLFPSEGR